jgi:hypothetical protein
LPKQRDESTNTSANNSGDHGGSCGVDLHKRAKIVDDIMAGSFAVRQSKTILARSYFGGVTVLRSAL